MMRKKSFFSPDVFDLQLVNSLDVEPADVEG